MPDAENNWRWEKRVADLEALQASNDARTQERTELLAYANRVRGV